MAAQRGPGGAPLAGHCGGSAALHREVAPRDRRLSRLPARVQPARLTHARWTPDGRRDRAYRAVGRLLQALLRVAGGVLHVQPLERHAQHPLAVLPVDHRLREHPHVGEGVAGAHVGAAREIDQDPGGMRARHFGGRAPPGHGVAGPQGGQGGVAAGQAGDAERRDEHRALPRAGHAGCQVDALQQGRQSGGRGGRGRGACNPWGWV
mmetsp:Transcript_26817/g.75304  ORF Transcript_26817/g.75304 Transcript_26817/m.75304 type:complete len:207 (-) Transcript_26817:17-637(-)